MFKRETWTPKPKENYVVLDREGSKETVALAIENDTLIVAVYNGSKWIVKAKNPLGYANLWKLKHLVNCVETVNPKSQVQPKGVTLSNCGLDQKKE